MKKTILLFILVTFLSCNPADPDQPILLQLVAPGVATVNVEGTNCVAIQTERGTVIVDTGPSPDGGRKLRETVAQTGRFKPVALVINTHPHWDHTYGNQAFSDVPIHGHTSHPVAMRQVFDNQTRLSGQPRLKQQLPPPPPPGQTLPPPETDTTPTVAHTSPVSGEQEDIAPIMKDRLSGIRLTPATHTFEDSRILDMGDCHIHMIWFGSGHSCGDIIVAVPEKRLLITGDILVPGQLPVFSGDTPPSPGQWQHAINRLHQLSRWDIVIPGHGSATGEAELTAFFAYVHWCIDGAPESRRGMLPPILRTRLANVTGKSIHRSNIRLLTEDSQQP